ncbi:MAG: hypothetical protein AB7P49_13835, partial [Bdellovibrionales bacterium]
MFKFLARSILLVSTAWIASGWAEVGIEIEISKAINPQTICPRALGQGGLPDAISNPQWRTGERLLGTGVLSELTDNSRVMIIGPYIGSIHNPMLSYLIEAYGGQVTPTGRASNGRARPTIKRIRWMGETQYTFLGDKDLRISVANHTSGVWASLVEGEDGRRMHRGIEVTNNAEEIPISIRAEDFQPLPFDPSNKRLLRALQELEGADEDARHDLNNSVTKLLNLCVLFSPRTPKDHKMAYLANMYSTTVPKDAQKALVAINQLVVEKRLPSPLITEEDVSKLKQLLQAVINKIPMSHFPEFDWFHLNDLFMTLHGMFQPELPEIRDHLIVIRIPAPPSPARARRSRSAQS